MSVFLTSSDDRSIKITHTCSDVWTSLICVQPKIVDILESSQTWWTMWILKKPANMMKHVDIQNPAKITRNMWILNNTCQQITMINVDIEQHLPANYNDKCGYWLNKTCQTKRYEDMLFNKPRNKPCLPKDLTNAINYDPLILPPPSFEFWIHGGFQEIFGTGWIDEEIGFVR